VYRINKFRLKPSKESERILFNLCEASAKLWNKLNYIRRQRLLEGRFSWNEGVAELYNEFKPLLGSTTTQQIIRLNDSAWRSFFALLKRKRQGRLPPHFRKVSPPLYWKNRLLNKRKLMTVIRSDSYRISEVGNRKYLEFRGLKIRMTGEFRWRGKQGRLQILYDDVSRKWYAFQSVSVSRPNTVSTGKKAFVDLGIINIITAWIEGEKQTVAYSGKPLLAEWWYWSNKIIKCQSELKRVNSKNTSKRLRKLYRKRQRRFRHAISTIIHRFVKFCFEKGVSEIIVGDITHIREHNAKSRKINAMIHNFWSFRYIIDRLRITAENFGIKVKLVSERGTSSRCPWCGSTHIRRHKRLFKCLNCGVEAHRDVVGVLNIALLYGEGFNRVLAHPVVLSDYEPVCKRL